MTLRVNARVSIPDDEIALSASPHGGPGGQHANRSATRVEVRFNVLSSTALSSVQKARLAKALASRISSDGTLRVASGRERSQLQNRRAALARLADLLAEALKTRRPRTPTVPTVSSKRARAESKRRRSGIKRLRQAPEETQ